MAHDPVAYTYEADYHCEACAEQRFGRDAHGDVMGVDNEGNEVGAVAPWDSWCNYESEEDDSLCVLTCSTCQHIIEVHNH